MRRIEIITGLQAIAWLVVISLFAFFIFVQRSSWMSITISIILVIYCILDFQKIETEKDFARWENYIRPGIILSLLIETFLIASLLYSNLFLSVFMATTGDWSSKFVWFFALAFLVFLLIILNLYLPSTYRMEELRRTRTLRQSKSLRELREDIQLRTKQMMDIGMLTELQRAKRGADVPLDKMEESLRLAIQKIDGIETILQYMILDKYLELLEGGVDPINNTTLRKWSLVAWGGIVAIYQIIMAILSLVGSIKDLM